MLFVKKKIFLITLKITIDYTFKYYTVKNLPAIYNK